MANPPSRPDAPSPVSIALIETSSIAQGYLVADRLVKAAKVELLEVSPVTPGKLVILYSGAVADLEIAHDAGLRLAGGDLLDQLLLPQVAAGVLRSLRTPGGTPGEALGVLECSTVAAGILAADRAAKAADVALLEIHAARGIGGKTTILFTGTVADVEAGLDAGARAADSRSALVRRVNITGIHGDLSAYLAGRWSAS